MPRRRLRHQDDPDETELNLAPIMNIVIILIPLLLLSVVFVSASIINIHVPTLCGVSACDASDKDTPTAPPLNLTVAIGHKGFELAARAAPLPPIEGCPSDGPTICLRDTQADTADLFGQARRAIDSGDRAQGQAILDRALEQYDWRRLYNTLHQLKVDNPDESIVSVSASSDVPFAAVVRLFDTARVRLKSGHYDSVAAFWKAPRHTEDPRMFARPTLSIVR